MGKKKDMFKEQYIDGTPTTVDDIKDPLLESLGDIQDPLEQSQAELEPLEQPTTKKSLFGKKAKEPKNDLPKPSKKPLFGKKQKNVVDVQESEFNLESIDTDEFYEELSIEELEQRERQRQRQELAKAEIEKKKADRRDFIDSFKTFGTLAWFIIYTAVCASYVYWLSGILIPSVIMGLIGSYRLTYWFYYRKNVLEKEEREFRELTNIATQINFNMQNGKNVADTLEYIKDEYTGRVGADINYTYSKLMVEGELITTNFDKYGFTSFDIFMRNLQIAYHDGIEPKKLFKFPLSIINYEAIERDSLLNKNKASKKQEMMTLFISIFIPASLRVAANEVFMAYLGYPVPAFIMASLALMAFVWIATYLQKTSLDVSVSI